MATARIGKVRYKDSFQNFAARLGIGTDSMASQATYGFNPISRNRVQIEFMYRGSWIVGKAVDCVAEDMTRAGIDISGDIGPDRIDQMHNRLHDMAAWQRLNDTIKWARLYGGALAVILVDGQDVNTPLRTDTVGKGQFKGLMVLDRWMVMPSLDDPVTEYGPSLGMPKFYFIDQSAPALVGERVHYSRVIRIDGVELPHWQRMAENGWGMSVIERLYDRLVAFDSATQGAAQLIYKAYLRTYKINNLRKVIAAGGPALDVLSQQMDMVRKYQSSEGLTLLDGEDEFDAHPYTFAGLDAILLQMGQQLSGAIDVPLVRLFGQSPAGLNATGEGDYQQYQLGIGAQQERRLRAPVSVILDLTYRSEFGERPPNAMGFKFNPLKQMSETEKATAASTIATAIVNAYGEGIIERATALKELRQSSEVTGVFSNVDDQQIKDAEGEEPPGPDTVLSDVPDRSDVQQETAAASEAQLSVVSGGRR